jgi:RNA polymerase sigma-70 factor (sigma-E family)
LPADFEEFVAQRLPALLRFGTVLCGDPGTAEDVVQEVLIRAHLKWRRISRYDRPEQYVRRMVVNEYVSLRRRLWRWVPAATVEPAEPVPDPATHHAERAALDAHLALLPPRQRAVLVLRFYVGMPDGEIAEVLGCRPATVRGHVSRALATLRARMSDARPVPAPRPRADSPLEGT